MLSIAIMIMFLKSQRGVASLWQTARKHETDVLDDFSQAVAARKDIVGVCKQEYVKEEMQTKFKQYERAYFKASFLGNIPSTVFFSLLNVGEGIALAVGIYLLKQDRMTLGEVYLVLSYVTLLNMPFFSLKYEFAQMPKVLASLRRIGDIYELDRCERINGTLSPLGDGSVEFQNVSFRYHPETPVLEGVCFRVEHGEHLMIAGRTGSGKSTVLQLIAGLYQPETGTFFVGGRQIGEYCKEEYNRFLYYILQNNPILEDTVRNNVTRYDDRFSDKEICMALEQVHMGKWLSQKAEGLDEI